MEVWDVRCVLMILLSLRVDKVQGQDMTSLLTGFLSNLSPRTTQTNCPGECRNPIYAYFCDVIIADADCGSPSLKCCGYPANSSVTVQAIPYTPTTTPTPLTTDMYDSSRTTIEQQSSQSLQISSAQGKVSLSPFSVGTRLQIGRGDSTSRPFQHQAAGEVQVISAGSATQASLFNKPIVTGGTINQIRPVSSGVISSPTLRPGGVNVSSTLTSFTPGDQVPCPGLCVTSLISVFCTRVKKYAYCPFGETCCVSEDDPSSAENVYDVEEDSTVSQISTRMSTSAFKNTRPNPAHLLLNRSQNLNETRVIVSTLTEITNQKTSTAPILTTSTLPPFTPRPQSTVTIRRFDPPTPVRGTTRTPINSRVPKPTVYMCPGSCVVGFLKLFCDDIDFDAVCENGGQCCIAKGQGITTPAPIGPCPGICLPTVFSGICNKPSTLLPVTTDCPNGTICCNNNNSVVMSSKPGQANHDSNSKPGSAWNFLDLLKTMDGFVTNASSLTKPLQTAAGLFAGGSDKDKGGDGGPLAGIANALGFHAAAKPAAAAADHLVNHAANAGAAFQGFPQNNFPGAFQQGGDVFQQPFAAFPQDDVTGPLALGGAAAAAAGLGAGAAGLGVGAVGGSALAGGLPPGGFPPGQFLGNRADINGGFGRPQGQFDGPGPGPGRIPLPGGFVDRPGILPGRFPPQGGFIDGPGRFPQQGPPPRGPNDRVDPGRFQMGPGSPQGAFPPPGPNNAFPQNQNGGQQPPRPTQPDGTNPNMQQRPGVTQFQQPINFPPSPPQQEQPASNRPILTTQQNRPQQNGPPTLQNRPPIPPQQNGPQIPTQQMRPPLPPQQNRPPLNTGPPQNNGPLQTARIPVNTNVSPVFNGPPPQRTPPSSGPPPSSNGPPRISPSSGSPPSNPASTDGVDRESDISPQDVLERMCPGTCIATFLKFTCSGEARLAEQYKCPKDNLVCCLPGVGEETSGMPGLNNVTTQAQKKTPRPGNHETCGVKGPISRTRRVVGGKDGAPGEWCWQAALINSQNQYLCGGALIGPQWVLTAAHCVSNLVRASSAFYVRLGDTDLAKTEADENAQTLRVATTYIHHNHNGQTLDNNIALLKLESRVQPSPFICFVCLPSRAGNPTPGRYCTVTGYGYMGEDGPIPLRVREANLPVVADMQCVKQINAVTDRVFVLPASSFCAGGEQGNDACQGDGGGPLVCDTEGVYELTGLVSWGFGCGRSNLPGIYVKVSSFIGWINQIISINIHK